MGTKYVAVYTINRMEMTENEEHWRTLVTYFGFSKLGS